MPAFMKAIGEVWRCANLYRIKAYESLNINSFQDTYLIQICNHPGITQEQLSKLIYVHKSNVARQMSSLEEKGFIYRTISKEDKRNLQVFPTQKAMDILPLILKVSEQWNQLLLQSLPKKEQQKFMDTLTFLATQAKTIVDHLEEE